LHKTSRFSDVLLNTAKVIFEAHSMPRDTRWAIAASFKPTAPYGARLTPNGGRNEIPLLGMSNQTSEAFAYIEREYKDVKGRIELQRRVVEQLHLVEADASEAEASLNALLDDEASKLRILDYLRKWLGDKLEEMAANRV
jgi:hypothetical protein